MYDIWVCVSSLVLTVGLYSESLKRYLKISLPRLLAKENTAHGEQEILSQNALVSLSFSPITLFFYSFYHSLSSIVFSPSPQMPLRTSSLFHYDNPLLQGFPYLPCLNASFFYLFNKNLSQTFLFGCQSSELRNLPCLPIASSRIQDKLWAITAPFTGLWPLISPKVFPGYRLSGKMVDRCCHQRKGVTT